MLQVDCLDKDSDFWIKGAELVRECLSADQHVAEETVTMTRAAEILVSSYNTPFTVCFTKAEGEERVLRGRLVQPEPLLGRSQVEDLDIDRSKHRIRQVDHRTIKWLIVGNVKYTVK